MGRFVDEEYRTMVIFLIFNVPFVSLMFITSTNLLFLGLSQISKHACYEYLTKIGVIWGRTLNNGYLGLGRGGGNDLG